MKVYSTITAQYKDLSILTHLPMELCARRPDGYIIFKCNIPWTFKCMFRQLLKVW